MNKFQIVGDTVWIELTQGKQACVDLADWPAVCLWKWYAAKSRHVFYARAMTLAKEGERKILRLHTLLTGAKLTDHKDGDGLNNRRSNLRAATGQQNNCNCRKRAGTSSQFKGVSWGTRDEVWSARIRVNWKLLSLGYFTEELDAARAYDAAAKEHFGEFARLNFPEVHQTPDPNQHTVPAVVI